VGWSEAALAGITATRVRVLCQAPPGLFMELREFECYGVPAGTPPPGGVPLVFEAEDAARAGVTVASTHAGFTGRGYGDYDATAGSSITWTVNLATAGVYLLDLRYANGGTTNRALGLSVNGTSVNPGLAMPVTGGWATWSYSADEEVILPAGTSTIRASAVSTGPNVDHLRLTPTPSGGG
jgi:endoglucanase